MAEEQEDPYVFEAVKLAVAREIILETMAAQFVSKADLRRTYKTPPSRLIGMAAALLVKTQPELVEERARKKMLMHKLANACPCCGRTF